MKIRNDSDPVLMVDDSDDQIYIAQRCYEKSDLKNPFIYFTSGSDLIDYLDLVDCGERPFPAIIFIDVNMPGINGHKLVEMIRKRPNFRTTPCLIMLTNSDNPKDKVDSERSGANGIFTKQSDLKKYTMFFNTFSKSS